MRLASQPRAASSGSRSTWPCIAAEQVNDPVGSNGLPFEVAVGEVIGWPSIARPKRQSTCRRHGSIWRSGHIRFLLEARCELGCGRTNNRACQIIEPISISVKYAATTKRTRRAATEVRARCRGASHDSSPLKKCIRVPCIEEAAGVQPPSQSTGSAGPDRIVFAIASPTAKTLRPELFEFDHSWRGTGSGEMLVCY